MSSDEIIGRQRKGIKIIGFGSHGEIYEASDINTNETFAVKVEDPWDIRNEKNHCKDWNKDFWHNFQLLLLNFRYIYDKKINLFSINYQLIKY